MQFILIQTQAGFFFGCTLWSVILVPQPGTEPVLPSMEAWRLNHWTAREVQRGGFDVTMLFVDI